MEFIDLAALFVSMLIVRCIEHSHISLTLRCEWRGFIYAEKYVHLACRN